MSFGAKKVEAQPIKSTVVELAAPSQEELAKQAQERLKKTVISFSIINRKLIDATEIMTKANAKEIEIATLKAKAYIKTKLIRAQSTNIHKKTVYIQGEGLVEVNIKKFFENKVPVMKCDDMR